VDIITRSAEHLQHLRAAAGHVGLPLDDVTIEADDLCGDQLALRGAEAARRVIAVLIELGYRWERQSGRTFELPAFRLLRFLRVSGPALESLGIHLAGELTVLVVLDEPVPFEVRISGSKRSLTEVHSTHDTYAAADGVACQLFEEGARGVCISPALFPAGPVPSTIA